MNKKIHAKKRIQKGRGLEVEKDSAKTLRTLGNDEAFYFYENLGRPTGKCANSLADFLEKLESISIESLLFHLQRKDFQKWIEKTVGDSKLARKIEGIRPSNDEGLRTRIRSIVENRVKELGETSVTMLVDEDLLVAS